MSWSSWSIPGLLGGGVAFTLAVVVLRAGPRRSINRQLALLLSLEGAYITFGFGLLFVIASERVARWSSIGNVMCAAAIIVQYPRFLGVSLETSLVAPFRSARSRWALLLVGLGAMAFVLVRPELFVSEPYSPGWADWNFQVRDLGVRTIQLHGVASLYGLVAALAAFREAAPGTAARDRAKWFAIAFGLRDAFVATIQLFFSVLRPIPFWGDFLYNPAQGVAYLVYSLLLSYGVLRAQLFDIDLKIKLTLQRSTVISVIAGSFFVGSELLESYIPVQGTVLGLLTAALVVLGLRPLQRLSERLVGAVMPGVDDTPEYLAAKKADVYSAAYELALADGVLSEGEKEMLRSLREQLGITQPESEAIERSVESRVGASADA